MSDSDERSPKLPGPALSSSSSNRHLYRRPPVALGLKLVRVLPVKLGLLMIWHVGRAGVALKLTHTWVEIVLGSWCTPSPSAEEEPGSKYDQDDGEGGADTDTCAGAGAETCGLL